MTSPTSRSSGNQEPMEEDDGGGAGSAGAGNQDNVVLRHIRQMVREEIVTENRIREIVREEIEKVDGRLSRGK